MRITQNELIEQLAAREELPAAAVRRLLKSAEDLIFEQLSSADPAETIQIKFLKGISLERNRIKEKKYSKGMFQNLDCPEHVKVKAKISKYYNEQINLRLFPPSR